MTTNNFAEKLKAARTAAGITQQGMFELLKIPRRTVQQWEGGLMIPPEYVQDLVLEKLDTLKHR